MDISVTILVNNTPKHLEKVLDALKVFPEVLLYDNGASKQTLELISKYPNARVVKGIFNGFGPTHNEASACAKYDWILSIDSDEVITEKLTKEIQNTPLNPACVYSIGRHNIFNGKWIKWCGWNPDRVKRLYHRKQTRFSDAFVHEAIDMQGCQEICLKSPLIHYSYDTIGDFLIKMQSYSTLFAHQNVGKKYSSPLIAILHSIGAFFKSFFLKKGFLGGYEGFFISMYNAHTAFYKYLKLYEANQKALSCSTTRLCPEENANPLNSSFEAQK